MRHLPRRIVSLLTILLLLLPPAAALAEEPDAAPDLALAATAALTVLDVAAGADFSLALRSDGTVWAWGSNQESALGRDGADEPDAASAVKVLHLPRIKQIDAQGHQALALAQDGTVWQWGALASPWGTVHADQPELVLGISDIVQIAAGAEHSLALTSTGAVFAWGNNTYGQLGDGTREHRNPPVKVEGLPAVTAIAANDNTSVALAGGKVWAWGANQTALMGNRSYDDQLAPLQLATGRTAVSAVAVSDYEILMLEAGNLYRWPVDFDTPNAAQVEGLSGVTRIRAGASTYFARRSSGEWMAWGDNLWGKLGLGHAETQTTPVSVGLLTAVGGGVDHTLFATGAGVKASGLNDHGQLGDGSTQNAMLPVAVKDLPYDRSAPVWSGAFPSRLDVTAAAIQGVTYANIVWRGSQARDNDEVSAYRLYMDGTPVLDLRPTAREYQLPSFDTARPHHFELKAADPSGNWSEPVTADWSLVPSLAEAYAESYTLHLRFDRPLQGEAPRPDQFLYAIDGVTNGTASAVRYRPESGEVVMVLPDQVLPEQIVRFTIDGPFQDLNGVDLVYGNCPVSNRTIDTGAPVSPMQAWTSQDGTRIYVTFNRYLDRNSQPAAADFLIDVNGQRQPGPVAAEVFENMVTLELAAPVPADRLIWVGYAPGASEMRDVYDRPVGHFYRYTVQNRVKDLTPPVLQGARVRGNELLLVFSESLNETVQPPAADFRVSYNGGTAVAARTALVKANTVALTLPTAVIGGDVLTLTYKPGTKPLRDRVGNTVVPFENQRVINATADLDLLSAVADGLTLTLTYAGPLETGSVPPAGSYTVRVGTQKGKTPAKAAIAGSTVVLTLASRVLEGESVTVDYRPLGKPVQSAEGLLAGRLTAQAVENQTTAPHLISAWSDDRFLTLTYDQQLNPDVVPAVADFVVLINGLRSSVGAIRIEGDQVIIRLLRVGTGATVTVGYTPGKKPLQDLTGDLAGAFAGYQVDNQSMIGDGAVPVLTGATVDGARLALTYDEPVFTGGVALSNYAVTVGSGPAKAPVNITVDGSSAVLTLAVPAAEGDTVTVEYKLGSKYLQDAAGNPAQPFTGLAATNVTVAPTLFAAYAQGNKVTVHYTETLDPTSLPAVSAFTVLVGGNKVAVKKVAVDESRAVLTLARVVTADESLTVQYNRPASRGLRDLTGTLVPSLPVTNVDNQTVTPPLDDAEVTGNLLSLVFLARLDPTSIPSTSSFVVKANGVAIGVSKVRIYDQVVELKLARVVGDGSTVTVSYTGKGKPIQSWAAETADPFQDVAVENVPRHAALVEAWVDGNQVKLIYDEPLDPATTPASGTYQVMSGSAKVPVTKVTVLANWVMLTLATPASEVDPVTVSYTPGKKPLYDVFGQPVGALPETEAIHVTMIPVLSYASHDGKLITLFFSEALNPAKVPSTKDFTLSVPGVSVTKVQISGFTVTLTLSQSVAGSDHTFSYRPGSVPLQGMTGAQVEAINNHPF